MQMRAIALLATFLLGACAGQSEPLSENGNEARTARYLDQIRDKPPLLRAFLKEMPKGADLHNHLVGSVYAESFIGWAAADGLCIDRTSLALVASPCTSPARVSARAAYQDPALYSAIVDALSMRNFVPGKESGHDHFFASFAKFHVAGEGHEGDMLAEVVGRAGEQNISYLELMMSPGMMAAAKIGAAIGWDSDLEKLYGKLEAAGLRSLVPRVREEIDVAERAMRQQLGCETAAPRLGCQVTTRYLAQVIRTLPKEQVFAEISLAYMLGESDPRIVGLNLVAPEDAPTTLSDYKTQMAMLQFLGRQSPEVKLTLHAGELTLGLVPPEHLRSHIRDAVEIAGARRIGHGVDLLYEDKPLQLAEEMADRGILVEINLTSNDQILGVKGDHHPILDYLRYGVPVALSTDDEGVSRGDLTREFERATYSYGFDYLQLKRFARNSIAYSFLSGDSLWLSLDPPTPRPPCAEIRAAEGTKQSSECEAFLAGSEKARMEWRLEKSFREFEARHRSLP